MNEEYDILFKENEKLKKEIIFLNKIFSEYNNSAVFNLRRVHKNGNEIWIDKIKITEQELKQLDTSDEVNHLLKYCNPKCER